MVRWELLQPADIGGAFSRGMEQGRARRVESETQNALAAYARNPNDPAPVNALAQWNPQLAIQIGEKRRAQAAAGAEQQRRASLGAQYAGGDRAGAQQAAMAAGDFDLAETLGKLGKPDKDAIKARSEYIGNAALAVSQLPPEQQAAAWDNYARNGAGYGIDGLDEYVGKFSPEALQSALAASGKVKDYFDTQDVDYRVVPQGGRLVPFDASGRPMSADVGAATATAPPSAAVAELRADPTRAAEFDEAFGAGAAARALGRGGPTPQASDTFPAPPMRLRNGVMTSGKRTREGNIVVGGVNGSWHVDGNAVDYDGPNLGALRDEVQAMLPGARVIIHDGHVHAQDRRIKAPYYGKRGTTGLRR